MNDLDNPERHWERDAAIAKLDRRALEHRLGSLSEPLEVLGGGLANLNVRIGTDRVARLYQRDPRRARVEAALLDLPWRALRVPRVLERGSDFLLLEYVAHERVPATAEAGRAVGCALAEIHARSYERAGELDAELTVVEPYADVVALYNDYVRGALAAERGTAREPLLAGTLAALERHATALSALSAQSVLLHADFKVSNLHWTTSGRLLVLDWEFAYAGPPLLDVGQLVRWSPPEPFGRGFADAYQEGGGQLPPDWQRWASAFDVYNLVGLLADTKAGTRREADVSARLKATVAAL